MRCHPSLISHLQAVRSLIGPLGVMPNSGKMISFTAQQSFQGVTPPVFCEVSLSHVFSWTRSLCNQDLALAAPPCFLIGSFSKIWKCRASVRTCWANQFLWPSCHCRVISKLAQVPDNPLRWRVAKLDMMRYWLSWERDNDVLFFFRSSLISLRRSAQSQMWSFGPWTPSSNLSSASSILTSSISTFPEPWSSPDDILSWSSSVNSTRSSSATVKTCLTLTDFRGCYTEPQVEMDSREHPWSFGGVYLDSRWSPGVCAPVTSQSPWSPCGVYLESTWSPHIIHI